MQQPERRAYAFLSDGEEEHLTFAELDAEARTIAAHLQADGAAGERVLLLGHFIKNFVGLNQADSQRLFSIRAHTRAAELLNAQPGAIIAPGFGDLAEGVERPSSPI